MAHKRLPSLLKNSSLILLLAIITGLSFGGGASSLKHAVTPLLGLIMTLSMVDISAEALLDVRRILPRTLLALGLNYIVLSGIAIGLAYLVIEDEDLRTGLVLGAAVPPAVAVIPFTMHLRGNTNLSLIADVAAYLTALAFTPLICIVFLGTNFIEPSKLMASLAELIVVPLAVSLVLRRTPIMPKLREWRGPVVNWCFFLVIYALIGLNRDEILEDPGSLIGVFCIALACTFVLGELINMALKFAGFNRADRISFLLIGTRKNYGLAGALALAFFDPRTGIPPAVMSSVAIVHFVWLTWRVKRME